jgi:secondary thiamine-phosphate synthase enzyme
MPYIGIISGGLIMAVSTGYIEVSTKGNRDCIDLTPDMKEIIRASGVSSGIAVLFAPGSTAGITTLEYEPGLNKDIDLFLERIIPYGGTYRHHETWHDDNGSSHLQAALIGPSLTVPFNDGEPVLGTWQQVVLIDCDTRPRKRKIVVQIVC